MTKTNIFVKKNDFWNLKRETEAQNKGKKIKLIFVQQLKNKIHQQTINKTARPCTETKIVMITATAIILFRLTKKEEEKKKRNFLNKNYVRKHSFMA